jgi:hypothetical protein
MTNSGDNRTTDSHGSPMYVWQSDAQACLNNPVAAAPGGACESIPQNGNHETSDVILLAAQRQYLQARPQAAQHPRSGWGFSVKRDARCRKPGNNPIAGFPESSAPTFPLRLWVSALNSLARHDWLLRAYAQASGSHALVKLDARMNGFANAKARRRGGVEKFRRNTQQTMTCMLSN